MTSICSRSTIAAALLTVLSGPAIGAQFVAGPLPVDRTSEVLVGVVNTCATPARYGIVLKNSADGSVLRKKGGTVAAQRGVLLAWQPDAVDLDLVVATVAVSCEAGAQRTEPPPPLIGFTVRDRVTKVPRFQGTSHEGTGI
jgi:hypothetical protein